MDENIFPEVNSWVQKGMPADQIPFVQNFSGMDIETLATDFIFLIFFIWLGVKVFSISKRLLDIENKINIIFDRCKKIKMNDPFKDLKV